MQHANVPVIEQEPPLCYQAGGVRPDGHVIARSTAMREILDLVRKIAGADVPVLILGETGVGKQTIAREIHRQSRRAARPFLHIVCGALRESDLEESLFGQRGDLFREGTGTPASLLDWSQSSTLFLDGVAQLPLWAQVRLLDALQRRGGRSRQDGVVTAAEARVIASSTCDLETAVAENRFFSGLYYYLNAVRIHVPPLRHRQEDILSLAEHFLTAGDCLLGSTRHKSPLYLCEEARQSLLRYDWPGNILQLAAVVAHAAMLAEGSEIGQASVAGLLDRAPQPPDSETISVPLIGGLKEMESTLINEVIRRCRGNKAAAARLLKLHRRTLYRLLEK